MESTLSPLTPRSDAALNRPMDFSNRPSSSFKASTKRMAESFTAPRDPPSSPFDSNIDQENLPPLPPSDPPQQSPSKSGKSRLKPQDFVIHEDTPHTPQTSELSQDAGTLNKLQTPGPGHRGSPTIPQQKSQLEVEPADINFTLDLNLDDITMTMLETDGKLESFEIDCDARSVASDDTSFSAFSAVQNVDMTQFSKLGNRTPLKTYLSDRTPRIGQRPKNAGPARNASPTYRQQPSVTHEGDTTNLLLDFTQQFENIPRSTFKSPTKRSTTNDTGLLSYINGQRLPSPKKAIPSTPSRRDLLNLLDFDLPPPATPRSIPSITVRELESLKSSYLFEISSLKASLSGREAEVDSLKRAVGDAERRVGEALEQVREERNAKEHAEKEKVEWEKKGKEVENVLMSVKEEFVNADKEREELLRKLDESSKIREELEIRVAETTTKASVLQNIPDGGGNTVSVDSALVDRLVADQLDEKMENLARELHTVYKKKHESKVATLKKTYEVRSEKKCHELQHRIDSLEKSNEQLQAAQDTNSTGRSGTTNPADLQLCEEQRIEIQAQQSRMAGLTEQMNSLRDIQNQLINDLEMERVEKGELVAAVDEMLALQAEVGVPTAIEDFRKSIRRPVEQRAPAAIESRVGRFGLPAPSRVPSGGKSRIMTNIERMGGGRAQE